MSPNTENIYDDETTESTYGEEDVYQPTEAEKLADEATRTACKQLEEGAQARVARFKQIEKNEAMYIGTNEDEKVLKSRHNVPFDTILMRGFVDSLESKIDEPLEISYDRAREQDKKAAEKVSAVLKRESGADRGAWAMKDLDAKHLAILSGRAIYKKYAERVDGKFVDHLEVVDHYDFITEAQGGRYLDKHLYKGQMNIFVTHDTMLKKAKNGVYNKRQVFKLFAACTDEDRKVNQDLYNYKVNRLERLGIDATVNNFVGSRLYRMTEWVMWFRDDWYYLLFNYDTGIWVRCEKLEKVFTVAKDYPGRGPWVSWPTHRQPFTFWNIAPADSIRPIGYSMKKLVNLTLDNLEKRNYDMTAYDPKVFTEPRKLLYKRDGLVKATLKAGQTMSNHIYKFQTPDTTAITIDLAQYFNSFLGEQTGITPGAKGKAEEEKVGIFYGNLQQVADRLGLTNKMYEQCHVDIGVNFKYGLADHMNEREAVKLTGNNGVQWEEELLREEAGRAFSIVVRGGNAEAQMNEVINQRKERALDRIARDPQLRSRVNADWYLRETLTMGGYDPEDMRRALDRQNDADDDILAEAAGAIEEILNGNMPKEVRNATFGFIQKIYDFAWDNIEDMEKSVFDALIAYGRMHIPLAKATMERRQMNIAMSTTKQVVTPGTPAMGGIPSPFSPSAVGPAQPPTPEAPADPSGLTMS